MRRLAALALLAAVAAPAHAIDPLGACATLYDVSHDLAAPCAYLGPAYDVTMQDQCQWTYVNDASTGMESYVISGMTVVARFAAEIKIRCTVGEVSATYTTPGMVGAVPPTYVPARGGFSAFTCETVTVRFLPNNPHGYDPDIFFSFRNRCSTRTYVEVVRGSVVMREPR